jgi:mono/diheme cytochrome c family protein
MIDRRFAVGAVLALVVAAAPALAADGAKVYLERCATCHGKTGEADTPAAKMMKAPALAGDAKVAAMPAADLSAAIKANPKHASMLKTLSDDDLAAVVAHVEGLAGKK